MSMPDSPNEPAPEEAPILLDLAIQKQLKAFRLEVDLRLRADQGHVVVLFGPSGSGKTMTLHCIAGVTDPEAGYIAVGGRPVFDSRNGLNVKLPERRVGYLPQNYALFPHLKVTENIGFGLFSWEKKRAESRIRELITLMQLDGLEKRYPRELSGGQQQRVALARALAPEPAILLLDEPFSALDAAIRAELRQNLALLSRELALPVVFITHDLEEAYMLADRIAVYDRGQILQYDSREEVFYRPATKEVARLVGIRNLWEGRVLTLRQEERLVQVATSFGAMWVTLPSTQALPEPGSMVTLCLRPERVRLLPLAQPTQAADAPPNRYSGRLVNEVARGSLHTLFFRPDIASEFNLGEAENINRISSIQLPDLELEVTAQHYTDLMRSNPTNWQVEIAPAAVHLVPA